MVLATIVLLVLWKPFHSLSGSEVFELWFSGLLMILSFSLVILPGLVWNNLPMGQHIIDLCKLEDLMERIGKKIVSIEFD